MANSQIKTIEDYIRLQENLASYHVIRAGLQSGLLRTLAQGQKTASQLADILNLDPRRTELICSALVQTGLVERYEDDLALSQVARMLPLDQEPDGFWTELTPSLQSTADSPAPVPETSEAEGMPHTWTQTPSALDVVEVLDIGRSRRGFRILEIGGGSAVFSAALAHRDPDCQITLIDSPVNLQRARETIEGVGVEKQFELVEGDYRDPKIPEGQYDLVMAAGLLHRLPASECTAWLQRLAGGLKPEGDLAIIDWYHGQEKGARTLAFFELELTLRFPQARLHRPPEIRDWLLDAGLENIQFAFLPSPPRIWGLVLGQKPA